jgi:hypothetical protein
MASTPPAERQRKRRRRQREHGLVELRLWVTPEEREQIRDWLADQRAQADAVVVFGQGARLSRHTCQRLEHLGLTWDAERSAYTAPVTALSADAKDRLDQLVDLENVPAWIE